MSEILETPLERQVKEWAAHPHMRFADAADGAPAGTVGNFMGASIEKLIERVTNEVYSEPKDLRSFLLTYRSFTTPQEVFRCLHARYAESFPDTLEGEAKTVAARKQTIVRARVFNLCKLWVTSFPYDFSDESIVAALQSFAASVDNGATGKFHDLIKKLEDEKNTTRDATAGGKMPPPLQNGNSMITALLDVNPEEGARQLALMDFATFSSIRPWECLGQAWSKDAAAALSPNIRALIARFNQLSMWVPTVILSGTSHKDRVARLTHILKLARRSLDLRNFHTCSALSTGLQITALGRLTEMFDDVPAKHRKVLDELRALSNPKGGFAALRATLRDSPTPCVPYIGMYLGDLVLVDEGNPTHLVKEPPIINFSKCQMVSGIIEAIQIYQQTGYAFHELKNVQHFFAELRIEETAELYNMSLRIKPRPGEEPPPPKPKRDHADERVHDSTVRTDLKDKLTTERFLHLLVDDAETQQLLRDVVISEMQMALETQAGSQFALLMQEQQRIKDDVAEMKKQQAALRELMTSICNTQQTLLEKITEQQQQQQAAPASSSSKHKKEKREKREKSEKKPETAAAE